MKQTKAEEIFFRTWNECKEHIETWGYKANTGFKGLYDDEYEKICTRTINAVQKELDKEVKHYLRKANIGVEMTDKDALNIKALEMVQATINNERKANA